MTLIQKNFTNHIRSKVISRPGYPARAQYKVTLLWDKYGDLVLKTWANARTTQILRLFYFGANAMRYQIFCTQRNLSYNKSFRDLPGIRFYRKTTISLYWVYKNRFPLIRRKVPEVFDLITLFDIIEHVQNPAEFLPSVAQRTKFALIKTPMETGGDWFGVKPPLKQGEFHEDGHINFYTQKNTMNYSTGAVWSY